MQEGPNTIYLMTGINEPYLTRAEPYLASINRDSNVQNVVITLDFQVPAEYVERYPRIRFLPISSSMIQSPNDNSCMQHGGFLSALNFVRETDILIYTDADIELQRPLGDSELELLRGFQDGDVGVGYNESKEDYLSLEAQRLKPTVPLEDLSARYADIDKLVTYNTGVLVANAGTYARLYDLYNQHWPDFAPLFHHYAKQQWLLSYLINKHFRSRLLTSTFHTHGHRPVARRVTGEVGYKLCIGPELVLFSHGMFHETRRWERRIRHLQRRARTWAAVSAVLALVCLFLVWRLFV
jgi:hypothetical protein